MTAAEAEQAIREMGPVEGTAPENAAPAAGAAPKRLYRIAEGAKVAGVATGLAAYFDIDVTLIRVLFVVLTILTGGIWVALAYIALAILSRALIRRRRSRARMASPSTHKKLLIVHVRVKETSVRPRELAPAASFAWKLKRNAARRRWKDEARRAKWEARYAYGHRCHSSIIGKLFSVLFLALIIWAIYHWIPGTDPFFNQTWAMIKEGWQWIFAQLAK